MAEANLKKQQKEYIAIGALVLVALFIGMTRFKKKGRDDEVFSRTGFNKKWKEVEMLEAKVPPKEEKGISYTVDVKRTPFESPFEGKGKEVAEEDILLPSMSFQGMVWSSVRPQAIINNKVYEIGDRIKIGEGEDRAKIKDITREGIHIIYKRKEFIVRPK